MKKSKVGNPSGIRFEKGEKECGFCHTKENVIQFERQTKRKRLPIIEVAFLCRKCAEKEDLIKDSTEVPNSSQG